MSKLGSVADYYVTADDPCSYVVTFPPLLLFFITLGLELRDTQVYEPSIRVLLGTATHFSEVGVLNCSQCR